MCRVSLQPRNNCSEHYAPADHHAMQCAFLVCSAAVYHIFFDTLTSAAPAPIYSRIVTKPCTYSMHICTESI